MALCVFLLLSTLPFISSYKICLSPIKKLPLPKGSESPTSISFNPSGEGPYCSSSDGRILKYNHKTKTFEGFAYTSPHRNASYCDNTNILDRERICGAPAGQGFNNAGELFVADEYYGLTSVGPHGGRATIRVGVPPIHVTNVVDVDRFGVVRFSDASTVATPYDLSSGKGFPEGDKTGSLYEYYPSKRKLKLLVDRNLYAPVGLATDLLATYVLITSNEFVADTISKYWLRGVKAGKIEVIANITGLHRKIKRNAFGDFWIANNIINSKDSSVKPQGVKINGEGKVLATLDFKNDYDKIITMVIEHKGKLYVGGRDFKFIGVYDILPFCP